MRSTLEQLASFTYPPSVVSLHFLDKEVKTGMVMVLSLSRCPSNGQLMVMSEYESGYAIVHVQQSSTVDRPWSWKKVLVSQPYSQPLLSLDVSPTADPFLYLLSRYHHLQIRNSYRYRLV